jgi:2-polyprenyl-6-methoxyphenol hydroxylase-like FAD-dependent oxidoreductase
MSSQKKHAIVIGGSIAGLAAARVLLNHFERVTLIERDHYPVAPISRPGIPQGRQIHSTLLRGQRALEQLFPGLTAKLLAHGAVSRDYGNQSYYFYGAPCPRIPPVLHGWNCSRLLLEWQLHQELSAYSQLTFIEGQEVCHLLFEESSHRVSGVQFRDRNHTKGDIKFLLADLVVDASGGSSHASNWLEDLGYEAPPEEIVTANLGYATGVYEPHAGFQPEWKGIAIQGTGQPPRGGMLMEIEQGRWMIVLSGCNGDYPPTEEQKFLEFAKTLPDPILYHALQGACLQSKIYGYRYAENRLRHFERLRRRPEGFIIMGDAVCNFNPIYGQGMTVAVLEALLLDACLESGMQEGFACAFQKKVSRLVTTPWKLATAADAHANTTERHRSFVSHLSQGYLERLVALLPKDQFAFLTFLKVIHMLQHPALLLHPRIILKVLVYQFRDLSK